MGNELNAALFLFDGDKDKAITLLELLKEAAYGTPKKFNLNHSPNCRWCKEGDCWFHMPDSKLKCKRENCQFFEI